MNKKERIVFAISTSIAGGAQIYLYNIVEYLRDRFSILVLCPKGFFYDKVNNLGEVELIETGISFRTIGHLRKIFEKEVELHQRIYVNAHLLGTGLWIHEAIKGIPGVVFSVTAHNKVVYDGISLPRRILHPLFLEYISKKTDGFIAVSQEIADSISGLTNRECEYIPSSVPIKYKPKDVADYNPAKEGIAIGFVGRIAYPKNPVRFVEVAEYISKKMPNVIFKVIGDGDLRNDMENCITTKGLNDKFSLLGFVSDPSEEMRQLDLLLITSDFEGTPLVLLEAMSYGLPVVSTKVGGIPTVIESGKDGVVTNSFGPEAIAEDVINLLKDREKYQLMSKAAFKKIEQVYSYETNINKYLKVVLQN